MTTRQSQVVERALIQTERSFLVRLDQTVQSALIVTDKAITGQDAVLQQVAQTTLIWIERPPAIPANVPQAIQTALIQERTGIAAVVQSAQITLTQTEKAFEPAIVTQQAELALVEDPVSVRPIGSSQLTLIQTEPAISGSIVFQNLQTALVLTEQAQNGTIVFQALQSNLIQTEAVPPWNRNIQVAQRTLIRDNLLGFSSTTSVALLTLIQTESPPLDPTRVKAINERIAQSSSYAEPTGLRSLVKVPQIVVSSVLSKPYVLPQSMSIVPTASVLASTSVERIDPADIQSMTSVCNAALAVSRSVTKTKPSAIQSMVKSGNVVLEAARKITKTNPTEIASMVLALQSTAKVAKGKIMSNPALLNSMNIASGVALGVAQTVAFAQHIQSQTKIKKVGALTSKTKQYSDLISIATTYMTKGVGTMVSHETTYQEPGSVISTRHISNTTQETAIEAFYPYPPIATQRAYVTTKNTACMAYFDDPAGIHGDLRLVSTVEHLIAQSKAYDNPADSVRARRDAYGTYFATLQQ